MLGPLARRKRRYSLWVGLSLLLLSAFLLVYPQAHNRILRRSWVPLEMPITLSKGSFVTPEFNPGLDTDYYISVEVEKKIEFYRLQCLLGLPAFDFERCKDV